MSADHLCGFVAIARPAKIKAAGIGGVEHGAAAEGPFARRVWLPIGAEWADLAVVPSLRHTQHHLIEGHRKIARHGFATVAAPVADQPRVRREFFPKFGGCDDQFA